MQIPTYEKFINSMTRTDNIGQIVAYDWYILPNPLHGAWMTYSVMLDDFARELANAVNAFTMNVRRLSAWATLLPTLEQRLANEAMHEFVEPLATLALLSPYMVRSRFVYATAHLCHQINLVRDENWTEASLPSDSEIYIDAADRQGSPWREYRRLKLKIEKIGGRRLREATSDFRNAFTHRFSTRIGLGITNHATRRLDKSTGRVTYVFGGTHPLDPAEIAALLTTELGCCYAAFEYFQKLVAAHSAFIVPNNKFLLDQLDGARSINATTS
ncbi:hypothetical protein [Pleomorphomonas sp. NRK KF1]|uniref:hypothetical protein n=1 Tax=Pleomorphomonas sp. NRK KF1 TaxID=2943000 RepID=UPI0020447C3D|nr:hypothetical protein [Pleomorphomonas sp. NRK KF1]MCM5553344.1 hypothetical protein [Pleomorphomonas sp. NRK KF1]